MDEDEEEEDAEEGEEIDEEEENDVFNKDLGRKQFGDTKHYCPVMLKETGTQRVKINLRYNNFYLNNTVTLFLTPTLFITLKANLHNMIGRIRLSFRRMKITADSIITLRLVHGRI